MNVVGSGVAIVQEVNFQIFVWKKLGGWYFLIFYEEG